MHSTTPRPSSALTARRSAVIAAGLALTLALSGCSIVRSLLDNGEGTVEGEGTQSDVFEIKVGDCVNDAAADGTISSVPTVPCSEPHDSEAYKSITISGDSFPGTDAVGDQASELCTTAFTEFVGASYEDTPTLDFGWYYPTEESWAEGDREILCLITSVDASGEPVKTTGTLADFAKDTKKKK